MDRQLKTVSFGGYDKKAVEAYIDEIREEYESQISTLRDNAAKLSDTVKNLQTIREVNLNESKSTVDNLKGVNDSLQEEVSNLRKELDKYKNKELESASRYESISRTLLEARESADALAKKTEEECQAKIAETESYCQQLTEQTQNECEQLRNQTTYDCEKLSAETKSACQEMKETTFANCDNLKRQTKEETDALIEETNNKCEEMLTNTTNECESLKAQTRAEVYNTRMTVKKECESISDFIAQLMTSVDKVVDACNETKSFADSAFGDLSSQE